MIMDDDDDGQIIFGDLMGLKLPDVSLTCEEKPQKTLPRKLVPSGDRTRTHCMTGMHATTCSTAVDIRPHFPGHVLIFKSYIGVRAEFSKSTQMSGNWT